MTIGPVIPLIGNACAPQQIDSRALAGFGLVFAVAIASSIASPAEAQYGTHSAAIYESQFKGVIWHPPTIGKQGPTVRPLLNPSISAPQAIDLTLQGSIFSPATAAAQPISVSEYQFGTHAAAIYDSQFKGVIFPAVTRGVGNIIAEVQGESQDDPTQTQGQIFSSAFGTPPTPSKLTQIIAAPQADPTQTPAQLFAPLIGVRPRVPPLFSGAPQADPAQTAPVLFAPLSKAIVIATIRPLSAAPQNDSTQPPPLVFKLLAAGITPPIIAPLFAAPQSDTTQTAPQIAAPLRGSAHPLIVQPYVVPPQADTTQISPQFAAPLRGSTSPFNVTPVIASPQGDPTQIAAVVYPSARAGFASFNVRAIIVPPQADPSQIAAQYFPKAWARPLGPVPALIVLGPQIDPVPIAAEIFDPTPARSGALVASMTGAPQFDPTQIAPSIWSLTPAPIVRGLVRPLVATLPQVDTTQPAPEFAEPLVPAQNPTYPFESILAAPQAADLTLQPWFTPSAEPLPFFGVPHLLLRTTSRPEAWPSPGFETFSPYFEVLMRVGDELRFGIDWTGWLENGWLSDFPMPAAYVIRPTVPNGFEYVCTTQGQTAAEEPIWAAYANATIQDGGVLWTSQLISTQSLTSVVISAGWAAESALSVSIPAIFGQITSAVINASTAVAGTDYMVTCTASFADGEDKVATIKVKVR